MWPSPAAAGKKPEGSVSARTLFALPSRCWGSTRTFSFRMSGFSAATTIKEICMVGPENGTANLAVMHNRFCILARRSGGSLLRLSAPHSV